MQLYWDSKRSSRQKRRSRLGSSSQVPVSASAGSIFLLERKNVCAPSGWPSAIRTQECGCLCVSQMPDHNSSGRRLKSLCGVVVWTLIASSAPLSPGAQGVRARLSRRRSASGGLGSRRSTPASIFFAPGASTCRPGFSSCPCRSRAARWPVALRLTPAITSKKSR